jgi:hypothetical protein
MVGCLTRRGIRDWQCIWRVQDPESRARELLIILDSGDIFGAKWGPNLH